MIATMSLVWSARVPVTVDRESMSWPELDGPAGEARRPRSARSAARSLAATPPSTLHGLLGHELELGGLPGVGDGAAVLEHRRWSRRGGLAEVAGWRSSMNFSPRSEVVRRMATLSEGRCSPSLMRMVTRPCSRLVSSILVTEPDPHVGHLHGVAGHEVAHVGEGGGEL